MAGGLAGGYDHDFGTVGRQSQIDNRVSRNRGLVVNYHRKYPARVDFTTFFSKLAFLRLEGSRSTSQSMNHCPRFTVYWRAPVVMYDQTRSRMKRSDFAWMRPIRK